MSTPITKQLLTQDGGEIIRVDPHLDCFSGVVKNRWYDFTHMLRYIDGDHGGLLKMSCYRDWGLYFEFDGKPYLLSEYDQLLDARRNLDNRDKLFLVYREWAPNAEYLSLVGDFNFWDRGADRGEHLDFGVWRVRLPFHVCEETSMLKAPLADGSKYSVFMYTKAKKDVYRMPQRVAYAQHNHELCRLQPVFFNPESTYKFAHPNPRFLKSTVLRIYECHVGISSPEPRIYTYREFADTLLPHIKEKHYNCIQILGIQEHSYYASFGYQVTSFFAPSSRYGSPDDFRYLVDKAHALGIAVLLDLVHSHASKNVEDGIADWDDSNLFFLEGDHPLWDSKVFDYRNPETLRFLLQNVRWWIQEYNVDGFRFDGVMSLMYYHRSAGVGYTGRYGEYFDEPESAVDVGGMTYLRLAHALILELEQLLSRDILTIAEDVSGYPGLASPLLHDSGIGFDYRFQMASPDMWIKYMKTGFDQGFNDFENLKMGHLRHALVNRRYQERHIVYSECHDQALVGDKTLLMWLLNEQIYTNMSIFSPATDRTKRGIRLHKLIRLLTIGLGGEGYLNFEGNEFGHPEWLDFPRPGNEWGYGHCRRQFNLDYWGKDGPTVRYADLSRFDVGLMKLNSKFQWNSGREWITREDEVEKVIVFERAASDRFDPEGKTGACRNRLLFVCSFHPFNGDYELLVPVTEPGSYRVIFRTNEVAFGDDGSGTQVDDTLDSHPIRGNEDRAFDLSDDDINQKMNGLKTYIKFWIQHQQGYVLEKIR